MYLGASCNAEHVVECFMLLSRNKFYLNLRRCIMRTNNRSIISIVWLMMFVLTAFYGSAGSAWAQTDADSSWELKLDAEARLLLSSLDEPENEQIVSLYDLTPFNDDNEEDRRLIDVFILLDNPENAPLLDEIGVERRTQAKDIVVARLPVESLPLLAQQPYVRFVESSTIQSLRIDTSRPEIQADQVHQGINLPQSYEGEDVVVGIVDSGFDFTNADFSDSNGTRIQYLLEYTQGGGQNEWTKSQIDADPNSVTLRGTAFNGHGTHVAGIAVGGGKANPLYRGIAPKADIILVEALWSTDIAEACDYIFQKAQALGKPAVINLSLGGHNNPHDGSSLYEQDLSNLTGPGRIIVASVGNEGWTDSSLALAVHAGGTVAANTPYGAVLQALNDPTQTQLNIWYDQDVINSVCVIAISYIQNQFVLQDYTDWYYAGQKTSSPLMLHNSNGAVLGDVYIDANTINDPRNGDGNILIKITNNGDPAVDIGQTNWIVVFRTQASGDVHIWPLLEHDAFRYDFDLSGLGLANLPVNSNCTVGSPASAKKVISVGSYVTKNSWIDIDGTTQQWLGRLLENPLIGALSIFSSKGPTRDKRIAPDITAPGERIVSALSSHLTEGIGYNRSDVVQGGGYRLMEGTSISAPHVTGIVALMLEVKPNLDYDQVVDILQSTARSDGFTGNSLPDNMFGAGKVDAMGAVQAANAPAPTQSPVYFADSNLKSAVESALGVTNPTPNDMLNFTSLLAEGLGITNLSGLEAAENLESLWLGDNQLNNVSALAVMKKLTCLGLGNNQLTDISPLAGLSNLVDLSLSNNQIIDIWPLAGLINLNYLLLDHNQIIDLSPLAGLKNLIALWLDDNQISDISPLEGMTNLSRLYLHNNQISDITPLAGMTSLNLLNLDNNQVSDITPLAGMTSLSFLWLENNRITDLAPLLNFQNLMLLFVLTGNPLSSQALNVQIPQIEANNGITVQ